MNGTLIPVIFPFFFAAVWVAASVLLGVMSGWFALQKRYPDSSSDVLLKLGFRSGEMGIGVRLSGILTLSACHAGLRVGIWRVFGFFQRPFLVPWQDIHAEPVTGSFAPMTKLTFGAPAKGTLTISCGAWAKLTSAARSVGHGRVDQAVPIDRELR